MMKYLLSSTNLSSVFSLYPSFRNAHSEQYHQISDILVHDIRPLTNILVWFSSVRSIISLSVTPIPAGECASSGGPVLAFLHLTSGASTKFNLHFVVFPSTYFKWILWHLKLQILHPFSVPHGVPKILPCQRPCATFRNMLLFASSRVVSLSSTPCLAGHSLHFFLT